MNTAVNLNDGPVTVAVSRRIKPERRQDYEVWLAGIAAEVQTFPGYLGMHVLRPSGPGSREYVIIFRFDTWQHLVAWEESPIRTQWLERALEMTEGEPQVERLTGLEYWFTLPEQPTQRPPPRYKMAIITFIGIFALLNVLMPGLQWLLAGWPPLLSKILIPAIFVTLMTYLVMPWLTRLFAPWLFSKKPGRDNP